MRKTTKKPNPRYPTPKPVAVSLEARSAMYPTQKAAQKAFKQGILTAAQMKSMERIKPTKGSGRTKRIK